MKLNDTVRCKNAVGSEFLTPNLEYILVDENQHGNWRVKEKESGDLSTHWYKPERFVLVKEKVVVPTISLFKKYTTRDGREVKLYVTDGAEKDYPVVGVVKDGNSWTNQTWSANGVWFIGTEDDRDLVEVVEEVKVYLSYGRHATLSKDGTLNLWISGISNINFTKKEVDLLIEARSKVTK